MSEQGATQDRIEPEYDLIVIGGGAVGENVADRAVQGGLSVLLVENELVGGDCSYWACMPSKALLRSGAARRAAQRVAGAREAVTGPLDVAAVLARRTSFTSDWDDSGQVDWVASAGIDLLRGRGRLAGERTVEVTTSTVADDDASETAVRTVRARHAVAVCTGSRAAVPDTPGLRAACPWTSREATSATEIPGRLAIIGGGVVAVEMATAYADLGGEVTLLVRGGLLAKEEPFAGELVGAGLREAGVDVRLGVSVDEVTRPQAGGEVRLALSDGSTLTADEVLVATGREPRTDDLGLDAVGLDDGAWLPTDDSLRVLGADGAPIDWLYAVGDANHRALLTHQGKYQARAAGDVIAARARGRAVDDAAWGTHVATADHRSVPQVTFADPEVASIGLTAAAAEQAGLRTRVLDYEIGQTAGGSLQADGYTGTARIVVDTDREVLVGVTFVGQDVAELLHSATVAVVGEVPLHRLWHAVPSYPTMSEVWLRLLEAYGRPGQLDA
ncbi:NAD(P)/FAD-dependent oxidoreductase [Occultella aeris]|uniref:Mercuric reductase n=1 Tax=Occultella aeris TaxID=2761496 RepID=A0A7M4DS20_9MICO|nr:NAD(P)/FAD-dependent oxidoreductase [Occultella aeris]VZO40264.1 Mercuric reductase [Occultella aeris]